MKNDAGITMYDYGDWNERRFDPSPAAERERSGGKFPNTDRSEGNAFNGTGFFDILFLKDFKFTFNVGVSLDETPPDDRTEPPISDSSPMRTVS